MPVLTATKNDDGTYSLAVDGVFYVQDGEPLVRDSLVEIIDAAKILYGLDAVVGEPSLPVVEVPEPTPEPTPEPEPTPDPPVTVTDIPTA